MQGIFRGFVADVLGPAAFEFGDDLILSARLREGRIGFAGFVDGDVECRARLEPAQPARNQTAASVFCASSVLGSGCVWFMAVSGLPKRFR